MYKKDNEDPASSICAYELHIGHPLYYRFNRIPDFIEHGGFSTIEKLGIASTGQDDQSPKKRSPEP